MFSTVMVTDVMVSTAMVSTAILYTHGLYKPTLFYSSSWMAVIRPQWPGTNFEAPPPDHSSSAAS